MFTILNITHILLGFLLYLTINYLGSKSKGIGYVNYRDIIGQANNLGFNFFFRFLTPAIFISIVSIIFYYLKLDFLTKDIYLVSVYYFVFQSLFILLKGYYRFINKKLFFLTHFTSIIVSLLFYSVAISKGAEYILPDASNFRTEIWFVIILYFYKTLSEIYPSSDFERDRSQAITKKYRQLEKKYSGLLGKDFLENKSLYKAFFSIMIVEDMNRTRLHRFFERGLFILGFVKTTGIMQVESEKILSDRDSIILAQDKILKIITKYSHLISNDDDLLRYVCIDYNGEDYFNLVNSVFHEISYPTDVSFVI